MNKQYMSGTYTSDVHIYKDNLVVIATSTVVRMSTNTKIVVHPGGTLILGEGSVITHVNDNFTGSCTNLWHGIIVLGDPSQSQQQEQNIFCKGHFVACGPEGTKGGGGPECIGVHPQGVLYSVGGTIRNANVAVSVGDELNPYHYGTSFYTALGNKGGGGYVYLKYCTFRNNKRISISFAAYSDFEQHSTIQNNTFLTNFYQASTSFLDAKGESFICTVKNRFGFPISGNSFSCPNFYNAGYWMNGGIVIIETSVTIDNNYLNDSYFGSCIYASSFMGSTSRVKIINNTINDNHFGSVTLNATDLTDFRNNTIYYNSDALNANGAATVKLLENMNSNIRSNSVINVKTSNYKEEGGILVSNNFSRSNIIRNNTLSEMVFGINTRGNNTGTIVKCNTLYGTHKSDIWNFSGSQMGTQGTLFNPNRNVFSNTGASGYAAIKNNGSLYTYYYGSFNENPTPVFNIIKQAAYLSSSCSYSVYSPYYNSPPCPLRFWSWPEWGGTGNMFWTAYHSLSSGNVASNPDEYPPEGSVELTALRNLAVADITDLYSSAYFLSDSLPNTQYGDSLVQFLANDGSFNALCLLTQWFIEINDLINATSTLADIETDYPAMIEAIDFVEYMNLMIGFADSNYAVIWLKTNYSAIEAIASDPSHYMYAKARVLCNVAAGSDSTHSEYGGEVLFSEPDSNFETLSIQVSLNCYPNPFNSDLSVEVTNLTSVGDSLTIELVDLNGNVHGSQNIFLDEFDTETPVFSGLGSLPAGYYAVRVLSNGSMIKSTLVGK